MNIDLKKFETILAQNKVYDAWQYVQSLHETLRYMSVSYEMVMTVYEHRLKKLEELTQEKYAEARNNGRAKITTTDLEKTNLNIGGYSLDDVIFLRKTSLEFFHYGRVSFDVLFQIINAALLGDDAIKVEDKGLLNKLLKALEKTPAFSNLLSLINMKKNDQEYKYLMAFDNYMKHIKNILITVENCFIMGNTDIFTINAFSYGRENYLAENALNKIKIIHDYVLDTVEEMLNEIMISIPNCSSNDNRIQEIHFLQVFSEKDEKIIPKYISFFIDVPNDISNLPSEIKVHPLIVKPNNDIYSFDLEFDKIFIRKAGTEDDIVGVATLKNRIDSNEFYRTYSVEACQTLDYLLYVENFQKTYQSLNLHINIYAMEGTMFFINE